MLLRKIKHYFEKDPYLKVTLLLLIIAFVLRIWSITWGLPLSEYSNYYHPDESKIVYGVTGFPQHIFSNTDLRYPTFYHYSLGIIWYPIKTIINPIIETFHLTYIDAHINMFLLCFIFVRFSTVLLGTLTILIVYIFTKTLYNDKTAVLASIFLTFTMYHVQNSSWTTVDVPTSFFLTLALYLGYKILIERKTTYYIYSAIASGILIGTKYTGGLILVSIFCIHLITLYRRGEFSSFNDAKKIVDKNILLYTSLTFFVFLLTTPGAFLKTESFLNSLVYETNRLNINKCSIAEINVWIPHIIKNLSITMGIPLAIASVFGLIYGSYRATKDYHKELPVLIFILLYFLNLRNVLIGRYMIMVLPLLCIFAAKFSLDLYLYGSKNKITKHLIALSISLIVIYSAAYTVCSIHERSNDTRTSASEYIANNIPNGVSISNNGNVGNYARWGWNFPRIHYNNYIVKTCFDKPDYIILTSFRFIPIEEALKSPHINDNYTWDKNYSNMWYQQIIPEPEVFLFYDDLLNNKSQKYNYTLVKSFKQDNTIPIEFPAPEIRIYKKVNMNNKTKD